jgi:hypothetical protein
MGHLFSDNPERGVFRTDDGGQTWQKSLYVNEKIGAVDIVMVQSDPNILYAAMYDKVRLPWHYELGGPESGIYKTTDGGKSWNRLAGGLPSGRVGRIGLDVFQKNPESACGRRERKSPAGHGPGGGTGQEARHRAGRAHGRQRSLQDG